MNELLHSLDWVLPLRSDELTPLMRFFTLLGYEKFILFFLPLGYWAWHRGVFLRLLVLVAFTALLNAWLKDFWQDPRPPVALRMDHEVGDSFGLPRLGEPYVTSRPGAEGSRTGHIGMGLGFFISKTLLERTGAKVTFQNGRPKGAVVSVRWPRAKIDVPVD